MKKPLLSLALLLVASCALSARAQIRDLSYPSKLNNQDIPIKVYLPPGYDAGNDRYPVVYNLHGGGGSPERQWDRTRATLTAAMEKKLVRPMIYVYVNGLGNTEFVDTADGKLIERSIIEELISVALAHILPWQHGETNVYGEAAFHDKDFTRPNEKYWRHADYVIAQAAAKGLYIAVLPMWCRNYIERRNEPSLIDGPAAYAYGKFLGARYGKRNHVVWLLGGDAAPSRHDIYDALAGGITDGAAAMG